MWTHLTWCSTRLQRCLFVLIRDQQSRNCNVTVSLLMKMLFFKDFDATMKCNVCLNCSTPCDKYHIQCGKNSVYWIQFNPWSWRIQFNPWSWRNDRWRVQCENCSKILGRTSIIVCSTYLICITVVCTKSKTWTAG